MEASERGRLLAIAAVIFIVFWSQCIGVGAQRNNTKMSYVCPPEFIRLGHSCYYLSEAKESWQKALFACKDRDSNLSVPQRWEDRNLRNYLNTPDVEKASRWIGGIYDYAEKIWKWGGELRSMRYQSFSKMKKRTPEDLQFHCISMMPELLYRWAPRKCMEKRQFICQTKLRKIPKAQVKDLKTRWQRMGKINEINAPSISREVNDPMMVNDMTANALRNPKSYDLQAPRPKRVRGKGHSSRSKHRGHGMKDGSRPTIRRRLKRPFPGYTWNRRDPEGSYQRNAALLRSGRTGLSPQQVKTHLARLQHLRDRQLARRARLRDAGDWLQHDRDPEPALARTHPRTYTLDNNISALHPKTIVEEFDFFPQPQTVTLPDPEA